MKINISKYKKLSGCENTEIIENAFQDSMGILGYGYIEEYYWDYIAKYLVEYYVNGFKAGKK